MSIIAKSDFNTDIQIANKSDLPVGEVLTNFINKYEPRFLNMLFGSDFAALVVAGMGADPVPARWTALVTPDVKIAIANYIYYYYQRKAFVQSAGLGFVKTMPKNAILADPKDDLCKVWEEMKVICWNVQKFLYDDSVSETPVYPEWVVPTWFNSFWQQWAMFSFGLDIFLTDFYYSLARLYCIPDIYYPLSRL